MHYWWEYKLENSLFPTMESSTVFPQKIKNRTTIWFCHLMLGYISKGNEIRILKACLHLQVGCSIKTKHGVFWTLWEKARVGWFGRTALKYVCYHMWNRSPVHETECSGLVRWDDPERWDGEGGGRGFRMGTHVYPWLIHVNVWQKPPPYGKVISL